MLGQLDDMLDDMLDVPEQLGRMPGQLLLLELLVRMLGQLEDMLDVPEQLDRMPGQLLLLG